LIGARVRAVVLPKLKLTGQRGGSVSISIGDDVDLGRMMLLEIDASRTSELLIGAGSMFEWNARIQLGGGLIELAPGCEVRGAALKVSADGARLTVGDRGRIGWNVAIHCAESVEIQDLVVLAERVTVVDSEHFVDGSDIWTMDRPITTKPVVIGRNTIAYSGAVIISGTTLGANSVVAANALVPRGEYKPGVVLVGNPARPVRRG
jgi:acetyltransferase-like isoleucine patch superfamily enzyme